MFTARKVVLLAGAAALSLAVSACGGVAGDSAQSGEAVKLTATNLLPPNGAMSDTIAWFMDELETRTDGEVETEVVYGGALLSGTDTLPGMKQGRAQAGNVVPAYFPAEMPLNNVIAVPTTGTDQATRLRALQELAEDVEPFAAEFEANQLVPIGFLPNASSTVAFNSEVSSLVDVEGAKLRIPSQSLSTVWEALGAEPVFMASEEVYEAVERGIVGGVTYPLDTQVANGITEVADHLAADVGQSGGSIFALNKGAYDRLSDDAKSVIEELKGEWYAKADELLAKYEAEACADFRDAGGAVVDWSAADQEKIAAATEAHAADVWKKEAASAGAGAVDEVWTAYTDALESHEGESDYKDGLSTCAA
jgi:TRAP-type transport system periplasmic protein